MIKQFFHAVVWAKRHFTGQYHIGEISSVAKFIGSDGICLDIGSHAGSWTRPLSKLVKRGHVYAFEALPYYSKVLKYTVALLRLKNVTVINCAVIDHNDQVTVIWRDNNGKNLTGLTHVAGLFEDTKDAITIKSTTVDSFIVSQTNTSPVAFVKCDVEGAELLVLRGAVDMIERYRPIFYIEVESRNCIRYGYKPENLFDFFGQRKYEAYTISGSKLSKVDKRVYSGHGDVLFVPAEKDF